MTFSRRQILLAGSGALAAAAAPSAFLSVLSPIPAHAAAPVRDLMITRRTLEVGGRAASVFGIVDGAGASGLSFGPEDRFAVRLTNRAGEAASLHWHGQIPPPDQDGVPGLNGVTPLADAATASYEYALQPGTHWMHSHFGLQEQQLMAAPLVVRTAEDLRADVQEVTVLLHDFTFRDPQEILSGLMKGMDHGAMTHSSPSAPSQLSAPMAGMDHAAMGHGSMPGMGQSGMSMPGMDHGGGAGPDLNDVEYDAYLANDRTLDDPQVVTVERGQRVRLRIINGATSTAFWIETGAVSAEVVAVDGTPVQPLPGSRFPLAGGQRLDLLLTIPKAGSGVVPVLARREGSNHRTGVILAPKGAKIARLAGQDGPAAPPLDLVLESRLKALTPLPAAAAATRLSLRLTGSMMPYVWSLDDRSWGQHAPLALKAGQRVELTFDNVSGMSHPMHLHGHHFQVIALDGKALAGAVRDTVLVPPGRRVTVAFTAGQPGDWPLHCHNLLHMAAGMMTVVTVTA